MQCSVQNTEPATADVKGNKSVDKEKFSSCFDNGFEWIGARPRVEPGGELSI